LNCLNTLFNTYFCHKKTPVKVRLMSNFYGAVHFYFMKKSSLTIAGLLKQSENKKSASFAGDERSLLAWS
ncbi:hypothetical protein ACQKEY_24465, partial [Lysinibacillus fusiformis]|uniref:hypothetical protein n=1 Tax=Lysinibacillus fusiformis TaxID=28031 RepID=UPI003D01CFE0